MATNKKLRYDDCGENVHYTPIFPYKPCTTRMECVTCPSCLGVAQDGGPAWVAEVLPALEKQEEDARRALAKNPERYNPTDYDPRPIVKAHLANLTPK